MIKYVAFVVLGRQSVDNNTDPSDEQTESVTESAMMTTGAIR